MSQSQTMKLWDYEHPYYMQEGNYFKAGQLHRYESWAEFIEEWGENDVDLNRIHRWDFDEDHGTIDLYYVMQRKAYLYSCHVKIKEDDHDSIREFLRPHAELNAKLWAGVLEEEPKP